MKTRITGAIAAMLAIMMMFSMTVAAATTECQDYNAATNVTRTYNEISFQTPRAWGEPVVANGAYMWTVPEGYIMLSYTGLAGINPLVITNEEIVAVPLTALASMAMSNPSIQVGMLPADNRNTCVVTATGALNGVSGTYVYAIVNSGTGVYGLQYFCNSAVGISRINDVTQVLNSITFGGSTGTTAATTATTAGAANTTSSSKYKYSWADWKTAEEALYQEYKQQQDAIYQQYRYDRTARNAALDALRIENQARLQEAYAYYHQTY